MLTRCSFEKSRLLNVLLVPLRLWLLILIFKLELGLFSLRGFKSKITQVLLVCVVSVMYLYVVVLKLLSKVLWS